MVTQLPDWTGEEVRHLRRRLGLSQQALAELLDVSRESVSRWELGVKRPRMAHLAALDRVAENGAQP